MARLDLLSSSSRPSATPSTTPTTAFIAPSPDFSAPVASILPSHFKSLFYDAAVWTLSSQQLQEIVSRTIRISGRESFIRLLTLELLDTTLPDELKKLHDQRHTLDQMYRDIVQRRSTLIQALWNACEFSLTKDTGTLLSQLLQTIVECDKLAEGLVRIGDQVKEIQQLLDNHSASALAIALRKLNKSYSKRTEELLQARERINELEAEREDAWREAEKLAAKLDALEVQEGVQTQIDVEATEAARFPSPPPLPTAAAIIPETPQTVDRPLPPIPREFQHKPQYADDSESDSDMNFTEEGVQIAAVVSVNPGSDSESHSLRPVSRVSFVGVTRTVEKPTLVNVPSLPIPKARASIPLMHVQPTHHVWPVSEGQELRVQSERLVPKGPTDLSGHRNDEEWYIEKDDDNRDKQNLNQQLGQEPLIVKVLSTPASIPLPKTSTNPNKRPTPAPSKLQGTKSGESPMVIPPGPPSQTNISIDIATSPLPSPSVLLSPRSSPTPTSRNRIPNPPPTPPPSHPLPPSPSPLNATFSSAGKLRSKRYSGSNYCHYQQSPLGSAFADDRDDIAVDEQTDSVMAARRGSVLASRGSLRLPSRTTDLVPETGSDMPSSSTPSSTNLQPLAMDDLILTSLHDDQEEKERMTRRGSFDEVSLVANLARRQQMEVDQVTSPHEAVSMTYYSFPNGSGSTAQQVKTKLSVRFAQDVRRASVSSGGIMGGSGVDEKRFTLNQLGSGIQKWKRMLMSQRGRGRRRFHVPSGLFIS